MFRPLELFIGSRYLRAKRRNHFISFISFISVFSLALGITLIITVLSVMNGFQFEIKDRILSMTAHATVLELDGKLRDWQKVEKDLEGNTEIKGSAPYVQGQGMIVHGKQVTGAMITGIDPQLESNVSRIGNHLLDTSLDVLKPGEFGILLGSDLANYLSVDVGEKITVITPEATVTPAGIIPKFRRFTVMGTYTVGMPQYDRNTASIHIGDAKRLFHLGDAVTGLRLKFEDLFDSQEITYKLRDQLGGTYWVSDWTYHNRNFFRALKMEKTMMFIITIIIVFVAAFNIISMLVMVVTEKQSDIAIMRTLGVSPKSIMGIFVVQGTVIGLVGTLLGALGGVLLSSNLESIVRLVEKVRGAKFLSPDVYPISDFPSEIIPSEVITICIVAFVITVLATIYPAWKAARTQPAEALRYE
ncbi:MAG: lipoprotein-releasing ABC transporter permease subunit [Gammaproteobacteria bacterium]|nr:lipoprotein-releasing ABC transporter permease subunit [Gammaproteobacteria bacterium]